MKPTLLLTLEMLLILAGIAIYAFGIFSFPILPLFLVAWASLHLRHMRWRDIGLRRPDRWLPTIRLALLVGVGYQALDILLIAPFLQRLTGESIDLSQFNSLRGNLPALLIFLVISWTEAAFIEEMYFRGYFFNRLTDLAGRERLGDRHCPDRECPRLWRSPRLSGHHRRVGQCPCRPGPQPALPACQAQPVAAHPYPRDYRYHRYAAHLRWPI